MMANFMTLSALDAVVPAFYAVTASGTINLPKITKKNRAFFPHPVDFTPVCPTGIAAFAALYDEFKVLDTELTGL